MDRFSRWAWSLSAVLVFWFASPVSGQLLVTDFVNGAVLQYTPNGVPQTPLVSGGLAAPAGMAYRPADGKLYISNQFTNEIVRYNFATQMLEPVISLGANYGPAGLRIGPDGNLYIAHSVGQGAPAGSGSIDVFNFGTNMLSTVVGNLTTPTAVLFDPNGKMSLIISEFNGGMGRITKYDTMTLTTSTLVANGVGGLVAPTGLAVGPNGNLFATDVLGQSVNQYTFSGVPVGSGIFASGTGFLFPSDVLFSDGFMFIANLGSDFGTPTGYVSRFDGTTGAYIDTFMPNIQGASSLALNPVPEPASLLLVGVPIAFHAIRRNLRRRKPE